MPTWFIGAIRYQEKDDSVAVDTRKGPDAPRLKTKTETYLIDAVSYTDAEARLYRIVADNTPEFEITGIKPMRLSDVFYIEGGDNWYKVKGFYMTENDKGQSKKVNNTMLINAHNLKEAHERIVDQLSTMLVPVEITDINLTPILEVVPHDALDEVPPVDVPDGKGSTITAGVMTLEVMTQDGQYQKVRLDDALKLALTKEELQHTPIDTVSIGFDGMEPITLYQRHGQEETEAVGT